MGGQIDSLPRAVTSIALGRGVALRCSGRQRYREIVGAIAIAGRYLKPWDGVPSFDKKNNLWDKLIVHAIGSSLSEIVLPMIARSATSMEALNKLIVVFSSKIKSRAIALKRLLTMLTQGNKLVAEFLQTTNTLADELALAQASILDDELVIHIFSGIIPKLNDIVTTLKARETTLTYEEVFDKLIDHENDLKRQEEGLISPLSVNYVRGRGSHSSRPPNKGNYCGNTFDPNFRN
ncbi:hypothetical protein F3Y22_tig00111769pilonHSYRG00398 [Hibiscus syriacus]|uniref:Uncharacterized protein n=1 Tax=Hibiscus syriacus TaxID=106335 RepID=A0A6A2XEI1_HIBSY|nr:hypothetical protein F3Y22_tig00111769pilonHSYRG00398 [Hibiscus syriacus]